MQIQQIQSRLYNINVTLSLLKENISQAKQYVEHGKIDQNEYDNIKSKLNKNIMKYFGWLVKQYVDDKNIDIDNIIKDLNIFYELAEVRKVINNDIFKIKNYDELHNIIKKNETKVSSTSVKQKKSLAFGQIAYPESTTVMMNENNILVLKIDSYESSCYYGMDTLWCISIKSKQGKQYWSDYYHNNFVNFYFIINKNLDNVDKMSKVAVAVLDNGMMDVYDKNNKNISISKFQKYCQKYQIPLSIFQKITEDEKKQRYIKNPEALLKACWKGHLDIVVELIKHGADINMQDKNGETALLKACEYGHLDIVVELLKHGADVDVLNENDWTALMIVCYNNRLDIVVELLKHGADVDMKNKYDETALMKACWKGHLDIVVELLKCGADVDMQDNGGWTALMKACEYGHLDIVVELLKHDANTTLKNNNNNTALNIAKKHDYNDIVKMIEEYEK